MKKIIVVIILTLLMIFPFATSASAAGDTIECGIMSAYVDMPELVESQRYISYSILNLPKEYPLGAINVLDLQDYGPGNDWLYLDGYLPNNPAIKSSFVISFYPMVASGQSAPSTETYINHINFEAVIICPTFINFDEFSSKVMLHWNRSDIETEGDLTTLIPGFSRHIEIIDRKAVTVVSTGTDNMDYSTTFGVYVVDVHFYLDTPINIMYDSKNGWNYAFSVEFPIYSPWADDYNDPQGSYIPKYENNNNRCHFQFPVKKLTLGYSSLDDIVAQIGSQLTDINNNLIILQNIDRDILDALKHSEYADKVDEYIEHVKQTVGRTEDAGAKEQELWDNIKFDGEVSVDVRLTEFGSFLWHPWVVSCILVVMGIAMVSYALYGKAG